jgi:hypothetical protein
MSPVTSDPVRRRTDATAPASTRTPVTYEPLAGHGADRLSGKCRRLALVFLVELGDRFAQGPRGAHEADVTDMVETALCREWAAPPIADRRAVQPDVGLGEEATEDVVAVRHAPAVLAVGVCFPSQTWRALSQGHPPLACRARAMTLPARPPPTTLAVGMAAATSAT